MKYSRKDIMEMLRDPDAIEFLCEGIVKKHLQDASFYTKRTDRVMEVLQRKTEREHRPGEPTYETYLYKDRFPVLIERRNNKDTTIQALHFVIHHESIKQAIVYKIYDARAIIETFSDERVSPRYEKYPKGLNRLGIIR